MLICCIRGYLSGPHSVKCQLVGLHFGLTSVGVPEWKYFNNTSLVFHASSVFHNIPPDFLLHVSDAAHSITVLSLYVSSS